MKKVLLIAGLHERYYYEPFLYACENRGLEIHICDPSRYPHEAVLYATQTRSGHIDGYLDTVTLKAGKIHGAKLDLRDVDIAWYLRENHTSVTSPLEQTLELRFALNETRQALRALLTTLDCKWVNKQETVDYVSSNKFYQQMLAASCGLPIPPTVLSNDPDGVASFSSWYNGLLIKSIGHTKLDQAERLALYSECFSHEELINSSDAIRGCPVYGQQYIEKRFEYRIMAIGTQVLSCRIDSQASQKTSTDWRHYDFEKVEHKEVTLPTEVQSKLLLFMQRIGLHYGAIDLIQTPANEFVFLEVNPSGQWGWVADIAGLPVPQAVADMLVTL